MKGRVRRMKVWCYTFLLALQVAAVFLANYLLEIFWLLFFVPVLFAAIIAAFLYHRARIHRMWSYLLINLGAVFINFFSYRIIRMLSPSDAVLYPDDSGYLIIFAYLLILGMTIIPILPVCLFYSKITHGDK